ncbi:Hypothetical protein R9X50_00407400 [Acrodontium crateriforme]|uniref:C2H2-type domain-containing protein n=1 Tax=Acrodontium crateriforme TaxID=150365 RepID=A0AAQ3M5E5_9PEZI|nr:Hypothetical protein R9X50_00407400 [Acrodontium crateriforme]
MLFSRRDAMLSSTATFRIALMMSTQIAFGCNVCGMNFEDEASLKEHQTQDYQMIFKQALQQLNIAWRHTATEVPKVVTRTPRPAGLHDIAHLRQAASSPPGSGSARSSFRQKTRSRCPHPDCRGNDKVYLHKNIKRHYSSHFQTQIECPDCSITFKRLNNLSKHITEKKCQRLKAEYLQYKGQADMDFDRRWPPEPSPIAKAPEPQHDFGDDKNVQSDYAGHKCNNARDAAAASNSATQMGLDWSHTANSAGSLIVNEAHDVSSLADYNTPQLSYRDGLFPMNAIQDLVDPLSWPGDSAPDLNKNSMIAENFEWMPSLFTAPVCYPNFNMPSGL